MDTSRCHVAVALGDTPSSPTTHTPVQFPVAVREEREGGTRSLRTRLAREFLAGSICHGFCAIVCVFVSVSLCSLGKVVGDTIRLRSPTATGGPAHVHT